MCRSIKTLRRAGDESASEDEVRAAALQFVRKVSGYRSPSRANAPPFDRAVEEIAGSAQRLLGQLAPTARGPAPSAGTHGRTDALSHRPGRTRERGAAPAASAQPARPRGPAPARG